jgi:hypothetical protein
VTTEPTDIPIPPLALAAGAPPTNTPPPGPPASQGQRETVAAAETPAPEQAAFSAPSGLLGSGGGNLAVMLGLFTSLGLAGGVLGLWLWQTRRY